MSGRIQDYWRAVEALAATLPAFVWLAGAGEGEAGFVTQVPAAMAARLLHAQTHRLASQAEVDAHHARERAQIIQARIEAKRRAGAAVVVVEEPATSAPSPRRRR